MRNGAAGRRHSFGFVGTEYGTPVIDLWNVADDTCIVHEQDLGMLPAPKEADGGPQRAVGLP